MKDELKNISPEVLAELDATLDDLEGEVPVEDLLEALDKSSKGTVLNSLKNCVRVFRHDPLLRGKIRFNILSQRVDLIGEVGWKRPVNMPAMRNSDLRAIHLYCGETYNLVSENYIDEALFLVADENQYHPVRDYLNSLEWDGTERVRYALQHFLGADCDDYTYEMLKFFMLGAASRAFRPGVKFDYMLCLVGGQGVGKSTFFRFLAGNDDWFCDDLKNLESDGVYEKLQGHWIIEMSEMMATINAKTNEAIKSFLSRQKETYRTRYDRLPEDRPRQCVFAGTTNKLSFLPYDRTGNRRFLPIMCAEEKAEVFILDNEKESRAYIAQMWAEIMEIYRSGDFKLKLSKELERELKERQRMFSPEDADEGLILEFFLTTKASKVCSKQLFSEALGNGASQPQRWQTNDICETVNQMIRNGTLTGWRYFDSPKRFTAEGYGTQKGWERIPEEVPEQMSLVNGEMSTDDGFLNVPDDEDLPFD